MEEQRKRSGRFGQRKIHPCAYSKTLNQCVPKYAEKGKVSPDEFARAVGGGEPLEDYQHELAAQEFGWTQEVTEQLKKLAAERRAELKAAELSRTPAYDRANPAHRCVNRLMEAAGMAVDEGFVAFGTFRLHLGPLYAYLGRLQESARISNQFAPGGEIALDELYVELEAAEDQRWEVRRESGAAEGQRLEADLPLDTHLAEWRHRVATSRVPVDVLVGRTHAAPAVVFGDPGSGKSTLCEFLLHALGRGLVTGEGLQADGAIPFLIHLKDFEREGQKDGYEILPYLVRRELRVPAQDSAKWLTVLSHFFHDQKPPRLLLIVDGIDEVTPNAKTFNAMEAKFRDIEYVARLIFTSRRAGFQMPVPAFVRFEIIELEESAMSRLVHNWFRHVHPRPASFVQGLISWLFADTRRHDMARNPCLLSLLCYLNQDRPEDDFLQAANRADLYRQAVEKLVSDRHRLGTAELDEALEVLAAFALDRYVHHAAGRGPRALFTREHVRQFCARTASNRNKLRPSVVGTQVHRALDLVWLRTRVVSQWDERNWYCFVHLSFQEYFAARWLVAQPAARVLKLIEEHRFNPYWREVWRFYAGLCREEGEPGRLRFRALATAYVQSRDLYDRCLLWVAPLCTEYGMRDTREAFGFDLREALLRVCSDCHTAEDPDLRAMVDLDPEYFLDVAKRSLEPWREYYQQPRGAGSGPPGASAVEHAVAMLECICHPSGLEYQRRLIEAEARASPNRAQSFSLGPGARSGRNDALVEDLVNWLAVTRSFDQRVNLINYLRTATTPRASEAIYEAAKSELAPVSDL